MTNQDYKNAALAALKGRWAPAVLAAVVFTLIAYAYCVLSIAPMYFVKDPKILPLFSGIAVAMMVFLYYPVSFGYYNSCRLLLVEGDDQMLHNMMAGTFSHYFRVLWAEIVMMVKIILWSFLLIIPGIVMAFAYAMTPFIVFDFPGISAAEASRLSRKMMKGHKFDLFYLYLSFLGWILLSMLTLGIGLLWLIPYITTATASFYEDVKEQYRLSLENVPAQPQAEQ